MTEYEMQLTGESVSYDGSGYFEFPENPKVINQQLSYDKTVTEIPYARHHVFISGGGVKPSQVVLNGTFHGSTRYDSYNSLASKLGSNDVQRFWLNSNSFLYVLGLNCRKTLDSVRNNFLDYVANLYAVSPFVHKISRNDTTNVDSGSETTTSALTNNGSADSVVKLTVNNNSSSNIKKIEVGDGSTLAGSTHKVTWSDSTGLASGETLIIYPFKMVNSTGVGTINSMRIGYPEKSSSKFGSVNIDGGSVPRVTAGTSTQVFSIQMEDCDGSTDVKLDWNDCYYG